MAQGVHKPKKRPLTSDTEFLICVYTYQGDSVKRIAEDIDRSVNQVRHILQDAKDSGRYDKHIRRYKSYQQSPLPMRESFIGKELIIKE